MKLVRFPADFRTFANNTHDKQSVIELYYRAGFTPLEGHKRGLRSLNKTMTIDYLIYTMLHYFTDRDYIILQI